MVTVTAEELECKDILSDVGICFIDDGLIETSLTKYDGIKPFHVIEAMTSTPYVPVSPEHNVKQAPESMFFEPLTLLSESYSKIDSCPTVTPPPEGRGEVSCSSSSETEQSYGTTKSAVSKTRKRKRSAKSTERNEVLDENQQDGVDKR